MKNNFFIEKTVSRVHFIGVGGISMSAIAKHLMQNGYVVSGSDSNFLGAKQLFNGYEILINDQNSIKKCDAVVVSSAISNENKELQYAKQNKKIILSRAQLLANISKCYKTFVGIAGTHGKTTVTALLANIFACEKLNFTAHIGGIDKNFSNFVSFGSDIFLSEVCEYKRNIKYLSPDIALVLNVDNDHLESYGSFDNLKNEFFNYLKRAKVAVCFDESGFKNLKNAVYFSVDNPACDYFLALKNKDVKNGEYVVYEHGRALFEINLQNFNPHDLINVVASVAVCRTLEISARSILLGIKNFKGVKRRNEVLYSNGKSLVIADYAHHPKQVFNAIKNYGEKYGENCTFIFQPHTYSRTQNLFNEFLTALRPCKNLYIYKTYGARENFCYLGSAKYLAKNIKNAVYLNDEKTLESAFYQLISRDNVIIVLGAGNVYDLVLQFLNKIKGL